MKIKYVNHLNEALDLSGLPYLLQTADAFDFSWEYEATGRTSRNSDIGNFKRRSKEVTAEIVIRDNDFEAALNRFTEVAEKDVLAEAPGRLELESGAYLICFLAKSKYTALHLKNRLNVREITIVSPYPFWIRELSRSFLPLSSGSSGGDYLDYPYDYDYDYAGSGGNVNWNIDHYAPSHFKMAIYGPCIDPRVNIAGRPYIVYDTVEKGEYIEVSSRDNTVIKYRTNGTTADLFDFRGKIEGSLFEPIPSGNVPVNWNGSFGFDITLFLERSEPAW